MNSENLIRYSAGGIELLDRVEPLWVQLIRHDSESSPFFQEEIASRTFRNRRADLISKSRNGHIRVDLAENVKTGELTGYCISTIDDRHVGEIDSIFVMEKERGAGIGDALMNRALEWLDAKEATSKILVVATGNERVHSFYAKYGFFPIASTLRQRTDK